MKPCLDCGTLTNGTRCPPHQRDRDRIRDRARNQIKTRRRANRPGNNAAARLRYALNKHSTAICQHCHETHTPQHLEIDHILPLGDGGTDTEDNLQILCKPCHRTKTITENRRRIQHRA